MKKIIIYLYLLISLGVLFLSGCSTKTEDENDENAFYIYFKDQSKYELYPVKGIIDLTEEDDTLIASIYSHMKSGADEADYTSPISEVVTLNSFTLQEARLILNFSEQYNDLPKAEELIMRAALVRTFTQLSNIQTVEIRVDGLPLTLDDGTMTGQQHSYDFVDLMNSGLNDYTQMTLCLYFADEEGDHLVPFTKDVTFSDTYSTEEYIMSRLVAGPEDEAQGYEVLPKDLKVNSVQVNDGICHVDVSKEILEESMNVTPEVMIYSIVNSLTELNSISGVRISVEGSSNLKLYDKLDLTQTYMRNLDILKEEETETN